MGVERKTVRSCPVRIACQSGVTRKYGAEGEGMSTEENKAIARRYAEEVVNNNDRNVASQILAPNVVNHVAGMPDVTGLEGDLQFNTMFHQAFPDARLTIDDVIAE